MTDLNQHGVLSPVDRMNLGKELLRIDEQLADTTLTPFDRERIVARKRTVRALLGEVQEAALDEGQAAFEKARAYYQSVLKDQVIQSVVGPVLINGVGWRKAKMGMKGDILKARLIEHIREILETGTAGQRQEPYKTRNDNFSGFYFIQKQVQIDDLLVTAGVTVAEDSKGNLFYNVSHSERDSWRAKENGASEVARVGPRESDNAVHNGMLDDAQQVPDSNAVGSTVADDDINITILAVVSVDSAAPAPKSTGNAMATGFLPQKNGGLLVTGDPLALAAYVKAYMDLVKFTAAPTGLLFSKSQERNGRMLPVEQSALPSGAVLYTYAEPQGGVSVAFDGKISGIARNLANLKSLMAQEWGAEKYRTVFGEDAAPEDVQAHEQEQQAIAQRQQAAIDEAAQATKDQHLADEQARAKAQADAEETARIVAQQQAESQAEFERTIGAGQSDNPIYQAYLDTLEELPTTASNSGFLGWAGIRAGEWERLGKGSISANKAEYTAWVRQWADEHLSERVKRQQAGADQPVVSEPPQIIEYKTKRDKILRGIIRTDLTKEEAQAIDPYTWRMNGGYFIREKHLGVDTSHIQAAPAPVVLSAEQQAEKQERDTREALQRQQQAVANQVAKLREVGAKAVENGTATMNADRKTNTARTAGMAASAYARGANEEFEGKTLDNIADAIEVGAGGALASLTSRAQLQELKKALDIAIHESDKGLSYQERQSKVGRLATVEDLQHVRMPLPLVWASQYRDAGRAIAQKAPTGNSRLIAALTKMGQRAERWRLTDEGDIAITRKASQVLQTIKGGRYMMDAMEVINRFDRLKRMGITNDAQLQDACRALLPLMGEKKQESAVAKAERAVMGQNVGVDFFPTPAHVAQRMANLARITKGMRVLEPSAGNGNLADAAAAAGGVVDVIEISHQLRDILTAKGYTVVAEDFNDFKPDEPYPAILMNPPFSKRRDADHIMRAYGMLASGGTLVAIAGEGVFVGPDNKAQEFRDWLDAHKAYVEKLDGGTFNDNALLAQTCANARLIVLHK
ncbi:hypothetical protein [Pseudomonas sp. NPDC090208]|uniref:LPD3 domain-containing protein n=1 Tax=Pseudomonas sp. NPDC090208 TaxID=3364478 RepID=UPI003829C7F8